MRRSFSFSFSSHIVRFRRTAVLLEGDHKSRLEGKRVCLSLPVERQTVGIVGAVGILSAIGGMRRYNDWLVRVCPMFVETSLAGFLQNILEQGLSELLIIYR